MGQAADRYAAISRDQWENYKQFGYPLENSLIDMIGNQTLLNENLAAASGLAQTSGSVAASEAKRGLQAYGINQTQAQTTTNTRLNNLQTTANMASARDTVRSDTLDRDRQILIGGAPNDGLTDI